MPLRKCSLKILRECCSQPRPAPGTAGGSSVPLQLFGALVRSSPPSRQGKEGSPCQNPHFGAFQRDTHLLDLELPAVRIRRGGMG